MSGLSFQPKPDSVRTQNIGSLKQLAAKASISLKSLVTFCVWVVRGFLANRAPMRAAGLAYATLLSLIPAFAVILSVTSAFLKREGEEQIAVFVQKLVERIMPAIFVDTNTLSAYALSPFRWDRELTYSEGLFLTPSLSLSSPSPKTLPPVTEKESLLFGFSTSNFPVQPETGAPKSSTTPLPLASDQRLLYIRREAARRVYEFVQNTRSGALGVTGVLALIFIAIALLAKIEQALNDIWGVTRGRSWVTRITNYWAALTLGPLLLAAAIAFTSGPYFATTQKYIELVPGAKLLFQLVPLIVVWTAFGLVYLLMPNARVKPSAAAVGALVAGTIWHLMNSFSFLFVSRTILHFKIYGSLGLVPIFMVGVYLSWLDFLLGAQIAYMFQHKNEILNPNATHSPEILSQRAKEFLALKALTFIGERFVLGKPPPTTEEIANSIGWPTSHVRYILQKLIDAGLVLETIGTRHRYVPSRALNKITSYDVLLAAREEHRRFDKFMQEPSPVSTELARFVESERQIASAITIQDLVNKSLELPKTAAQLTDPQSQPKP